MFKIVTITKQGQISIPASFWKKLGLREGNKVYMRVQDEKMIIEPVADLLEQAGTLASKRLTGKSIEEIISIEKRAIKDGFAGTFRSKK